MLQLSRKTMVASVAWLALAPAGAAAKLGSLAAEALRGAALSAGRLPE